jgi:hypothetical protein
MWEMMVEDMVEERKEEERKEEKKRRPEGLEEQVVGVTSPDGPFPLLKRDPDSGIAGCASATAIWPQHARTDAPNTWGHSMKTCGRPGSSDSIAMSAAAPGTGGRITSLCRTGSGGSRESRHRQEETGRAILRRKVVEEEEDGSSREPVVGTGNSREQGIVGRQGKVDRVVVGQ